MNYKSQRWINFDVVYELKEKIIETNIQKFKRKVQFLENDLEMSENLFELRQNVYTKIGIVWARCGSEDADYTYVSFRRKFYESGYLHWYFHMPDQLILFVLTGAIVGRRPFLLIFDG